MGGHGGVDGGGDGAWLGAAAGRADQFPTASDLLDLGAAGVAEAGALVAAGVVCADLEAGVERRIGDVLAAFSADDGSVELLEVEGAAGACGVGVAPSHDAGLGANFAHFSSDGDGSGFRGGGEFDEGDVVGAGALVLRVDDASVGADDFAAFTLVVGSETEFLGAAAHDAVGGGNYPAGCDECAATATEGCGPGVFFGGAFSADDFGFGVAFVGDSMC